ncbi:MAG: NEW3 domain-containing protein, partial [Desulfobacteraceae bacterium]
AIIGLCLIAGGVGFPAHGHEEEKKDLPPRGISVAPEYSGVIAAQGEDVSVDIKLVNKGRQDEIIELTLPSVPKGWTAMVKTYSFGVTGVYVESDKSKSLTLKAEPDDDVGPGKYTFLVKGRTQDGELTSSGSVVITVKPKEVEKKSKDVKITTSYPVLEGPTDATFEFSIEVENKLDKDTVFNLAYEGPRNWDIKFKPAYEQKYFSSLRIKQGQSESMAVEVKPYLLAEPGRYPLKVKVSSPEAKAEAEIMVVLTGTYKLDAGTADGLLSLSAIRGKEANLSFYVKNTGSAKQNTVKFLSFKPENWKVTFKPETLETLAPGDLKQVEMTITPAEEALVGDYSVGLAVEGEKAKKNLEFRVTVKASTAWGLIGVIIILVVVAGLLTTFFRFGRR